MLWEELSANEFDACISKSEGVCVLPMGVLEKHGDHLPLGTDMYIVTEVAKAAAAVSPTVIFPYYFLGQIAEARHVKGTIAASHRLLMDALLEMCDEIHRNGFKKILLLSGHGGNVHFLPFFAQMFPGLNRPYAVYTYFVHNTTEEESNRIKTITGVDDMGMHAGFGETSLMMHLRPDLVHMDEVNVDESINLDRLSEVEKTGAYTGFGWYAKFPHHFAGDPSQASAEHGKVIFDVACNRVVEILNAIKKDDKSLPLIEEYNELAI